jgi:hypothetical protein
MRCRRQIDCDSSLQIFPAFDPPKFAGLGNQSGQQAILSSAKVLAPAPVS